MTPSLGSLISSDLSGDGSFVVLFGRFSSFRLSFGYQVPRIRTNQVVAQLPSMKLNITGAHNAAASWVLRGEEFEGNP